MRIDCAGFLLRMWLSSLNALHTHGHALGGMTYVINGLERPIAIVAMRFLRIHGWRHDFYKDALRTNRRKL